MYGLFFAVLTSVASWMFLTKAFWAYCSFKISRSVSCSTCFFFSKDEANLGF